VKPLARAALVGGAAVLGYAALRWYIDREFEGIGSGFGGIAEGIGGGLACTLGTCKQDLPHGPIQGKWIDPNAPAEIRSLALTLENNAHWPNLGNFLAATAWTESRGNEQAGSSANNNDARGWFGLRPASAMTQSYGFADPNILKRGEYAVVFAADYIDRLRKYKSAYQTIDWLAIRRGFAYPDLVDDVYENDDRSRDVHARFSEGVKNVGLPSYFMTMPAFPTGYSWPGFAATLPWVVGIA
jgi:hypothetical protein